ncbi:hypothetical protein SAMN05518672_102116 [Chitinophaga sp. CF118]|uniref:hypothetical protein n=1 Tax=Chitinophaga sp. CF118 TaxID=1884367 RepID=UPI0008DEFB19|nr:hypothetical protein [Chitinophaga sp. CF118]SFD47985.1 hypothetical protein SAMN05518672_102116 [Chitinophaga sp. CF118]
MLELPITVRIPTDQELDYRPDLDEILMKRRKANIREGYMLKMNDNPRLPFRFQATINIDNSSLWELFQALAATFPSKVSCVYGLHEDESATTEQLQKAFVLKELERYESELTQDCQLEFGLLFHNKDVLIELSVSESKYIRYWGVELERFKQLMQSFQLPADDKLEFIDEYPKIVLPLREVKQGSKAPETVIYYLDQAFHIDRSASNALFD